MGKGGPLAFLNKKHFHTGSIRNVEEVWKREQKAAREEARLEELRKQIAQERQLEELEKVAEKAGHSRPQDRLDWMYGGGVVEKTDAQRKKEEAEDMSKPVKFDEPRETTSRVQQVSVLPSFYVDDTPHSANEAWARLNNDPLMMIKRQEQEAIKRIRQNPVQMERIKKEVRKVKDIKKEKKKLKKEIRELRKQQSRIKEEKSHADHPTEHDARLKRKRPSDDRSPRRHHKEGYGLQLSSFHVEDDAALRDRAEDTRRRIKEAEERNAVKRKKEEAERYHRRSHRVGRLSAEEKAARLTQMTEDASARHRSATVKIEEAEQRDQAELDALKRKMKRMGSGQGAAHEMSAAVAGWVNKEGRKLEDSVASRKYYSQSRRTEKFGR